MTTVGFGSGSYSNNIPRKDRGKKRKQLHVRQSLLESLEARHLMAAGPQLVGVQPNEGSVISLGSTGANATVLNVSPREIVLRFDDIAALDVKTLSGIQVKRAGADGILETSYLSTDLGTNGQVVLDFSASLPGQQGNGLELRFTQTARSSSIPGKPASWPILSVEGSRINIDVNTLAGSKTTASDLIRGMSEDVQVASKVLVKRLRGVESTVVADTVPVGRIVTLQGADAARVSTNLNSGSNTLQVEFLSTRPGNAGSNSRVEFTSRDFAGQLTPIVTVSGQTVRVEVNRNARFLTTVQEVIDAVNNSPEAAFILQARLISGSPSARIGGNFSTPLLLTLVSSDDVSITPAYVGFGDTNREVVIRFAEALPDDFYLIDILGNGPFALRNASGLPFNGGVNQSVRFDLDLGTTIQAVVPQPVIRAANGTLTQLRNQIYVYFNNDDLNTVEAVKPEFYQLVYTRNSLSGLDDIAFRPSSVSYDAALNRVALTFNRNIDAFVDPSTSEALPIAAMRLRIGNSESPTTSPVTVINPAVDPGSRFNNATDLGGGWLAGAGAKAAIVNSEIKNTSSYTLDYPGANDEQGNRDNRYEHHVTRVDTDGIAVISYNFSQQLGTANQSVQLNTITDQQKYMVRQVMSLYERYLGVRFTESDNLGFTIAVGDMQAINSATSLTTVEANRPGGLTYAAGPLLTNPVQSAVIIDSQDFNTADDNVFGTELFRSFMRGIGVLLGLGSADEFPQATVQNNSPITDPTIEQVFPGNADIVHGQFVLRPEGKDIDLYRFAIPSQGGRLQLQIAAERQADSSLLDASLRLYRNDGTTAAPNWIEIAANEDYFSEDPRISLDFVRGGDYIVGVSAKGNTSYDPKIEDSGLGGKSEGKYQLRIDYKPPAASTLVDVNGSPTPIDGDGNGRPGGVFNYWFVPTRPDRATVVVGTPDTSAYTVWVDKTAAANGNGTLARPYTSIAAALVDAGNVTRNDSTGNRAVTVRILGNTTNRAYEIGFNRFGAALADGSTFDVPKNVTVMIDAGAIIKMGRARISAGSSTVSVDRSGGTLQLLGIPDAKVIVTSINDTVGIGVNPDRTPPAAAPGDWGGIDFRNRIDGSDETRADKERNGLFLNSVIHSDIRFGGGQVVVDGLSQIITPIHMVDSRPSIYNNLITLSADAALAATPNSFKEDDFLDPRSQANGFFIPDYDRVGPDIHGNKVINNTINGLFVKTKTGVAETLETISVSARFDDIDIPYVIGENLVISGKPGGGIIDTASPPTTVVTLIAVAGGSLAAGTYNYRLVYVDAAGNESLASIPTSSLSVVANSSISLANLPPVGSGLPYVARRLYRSDATGAGTYRLVSQLNAVANTFVDNGSQTGGALVPLTIKVRSRLDGGLVIDAGAILKFRGSRIELSDGGTLIAEGTASLPIVMTSLNDNRYGFGGTFDTANTQGTRTANKGDWGGIFVGQGSSASLDYNRLSYAGGTTRVEGGFASFNAIEVHQADFRLANSRLQNNDAGNETSTSSTRVGRGTNSPGTVFVRGAQPIIINNRMSDNSSAAISIDVNSLNSDLVNDHGRMSGEIGLTEDFIENQGPLISGNRLSRNGMNGLLVRGQTLTTQSVWDDTDIVHVLENEVISSNSYTYGGVKLLSKNSQSLVVKLLGPNAGFTATGVPLDINDRIGGSVSIVGAPSSPVILTSISDCTAGAGFTIEGLAQTDTINSCSSQSTIGADVIVIMDESASMTFAQQFSVQLIANLEAGFQKAGVGTVNGNRYGLVGYGNFAQVPRSIPVGGNGDLFGTATEYGVAANANLVVDGDTEDGWAAIDYTLNNYAYRPGAAKYAILVTNEDRDEISPQNKQDLKDRLNAQGIILNGIYESTIQDSTKAFPFLALDNQTRVYKGNGSGGYRTELGGSVAFAFGTTEEDYIDLSFATNGIAGDIEQISAGGLITQSFGSALVNTFIGQAGAGVGQPGDWKGVGLTTYSNDRNFASMSERESARASSPASNDSPSTSQFLGQLAKVATSGDENARLGFEVQGALNKPSDVDVFSFTANGGTEVWLDIDRSSSGLDSVVELVAADGTILALSDDSYLEETQPSTHPLYSTLSGNSVNPLRKGSLIQVPKSSRGEARDDFGTNPKDGGMRIVLPGQSDQATLYHVRVRSSNQSPGQAASTPSLSNPSSVGQGLSRGSYQLQIRLGEAQEFPGSSISFADVRYAASGITLSGVPRHSPLVGETAEVQITNNDVFANAQELGNIVQSDRQTVSVSGTLSSNTDVDWFAFSIDYQSLISPLAKYLSTVFDVDYADGIGRADMSMYLFDSTGRLVQFGENSNILDDRAAAARGADNTDLGRGSTGSLDPFIGSVELPAGRYFLALTNRTQVPSVIANRLNRVGTQNDSGVRVQPVNSGRYIVEDRIGNDRRGAAAQAPITPSFLPQSSRVEYKLGDVPLYFNRDAGLKASEVLIGNSFTGAATNFVGANTEDLRDIAMRPNGDIRSFRSLEQGVGDANLAYINVNSGTGATAVVGNFNNVTSRLVTTVTAGTPPTVTIALAVENVGMDVEALTFADFQGAETGFLVANRQGGIGAQYVNNILYRFDPNTGAGISFPALDNAFNIITTGTPDPPDIIRGAGTSVTERGFIQTSASPGTFASAVAVTEATEVGASTRSLIRDGDTVTLRAFPSTFVTFEFNSGPELILNFAPNASPPRRLNNGDRFIIDGVNYQIETSAVSTVPAGFRPVFYSQSMTNEQFVEALRQAVPSTIQIGFDGNRLNFGKATTGSFGTLVSRGVATDVGSSGTVGSGRIPVDFLAGDTAETIAVRLAQTIASAGFAGLSAVANGNLVQLVGAEVTATTGSSRLVGVAPGGLVRGVASIGPNLYAVSDLGGLYRVTGGELATNRAGAIGTYVTTSHQLLGIRFNALTAGPRNLDGGRYANLLFGTDLNGTVYAFNTSGELQNVFANGQSSIASGISGVNGLAFSNLDFNLWHQTTQRGTDAGHGINTPNDLSDIPNTGDTSWYFGFENPFNAVTGNPHSNATFNTANSPLTTPKFGNEAVQNTYNFAGGALGVLESQSFSLAGMTVQDVPTLYFNYFMDNDDGTSLNNALMTDSFRVFGADDAGVWHQLTTNNSDPNEILLNPDKVVEKTTNNLTNSTTAPGRAWRQARVDLAILAGSKDAKLRFEFSTAGSMGYGTQRGGGLEMRVVAGNRLSDGQTFTVGGKQFEIELGYSLVIPSGANVTNGDTFNVLGLDFVFWNGVGTAPAGNVIRFNATDSPEVLAQSIFAVISTATYPKPNQTANLADPSGGSDTIDKALPIGVIGGAIRVTGVGAIGDNPNLLTGVDRDIDLFQLNLEAGSSVVLTAASTTVAGGSSLDPFLRLFDASGNEVASNNDFGGTRDSRILFNVPKSGRFYLGVSGSSNTRYNPNVANSGAIGGSQGPYDLTVDVSPRLNFSIVGNRIQADGAGAITLPVNSPLSLIGQSGLSNSSNVPVYIQQSMTEAEVAQQVAQAMERALAGGLDGYATYKQRGNFIDVTGLTVSSAGPFSVSTPRAEDRFSEYGTAFLPSATRAQNNAFEGLYLDDFIIGLAERGETVTGARVDTNFVSVPSAGSEILVGPYQLEIRGGQDYGQPLLPSQDTHLKLVTSFEPNQQQSRSQTVKFNGSFKIADGQTIVLNDGINSVTLEFDDLSLLPNSPSRGVRPGNLPVPYNSALNESGNVIAARVRDLINASTVQGLLRISAISSDGSLTGQNTDQISLVGTITVTLPSSVGVAQSLLLEGDRNTPREQGQVVVENSRVSNSAGFGITLKADPRDPISNSPNPGSVRNTITLNNQRLIPGAVVVNNELVGNIGGGINIVGDIATGNVPAAPVPFARIVNNTILGGTVTEIATPPAATFGDDFYRVGSISFADSIRSYNPRAGGGPVPIAGLQVSSNAIGIPDYTGIGEPLAGQGVVSLGRGGSLVVQFTNNILTGSDDPRADLAVYEVGSPEQVRVEVSSDGVNYTSVGFASFVSRYIDLDAFGFNSLSQLYFVRLTDLVNEGAFTGDSVGADIDAVGAISSRPGQSSAPSGTGIRVGGNASPTILNNIVANNSSGLFVDSTSTTTVVGATLFQGNTANTTGSASLGQFPITAPITVPLFMDAASRNLYPVSNSPAIDATIDTLVDRSALLSVKQPLGLAASPIIAPSTDINGLLRVDDPSVETPPGLGEGIFKDRGAADRADFVGPSAIAIHPFDNDALGEDANPAIGIVELTNRTLTYFDVQILDSSQVGNKSEGTGVNPKTVTRNSVLLYQNGKILVESLDYRFGFDPTNNIVRLTPLSGVWDSESVYQIRFINTNESSIDLVAPKQIVDGTTYTILDTAGTNTTFELDTGIRLKVPASADGFTTTAVDGTIFRVDDGFRRVTFEFDNNAVVGSDNIPILIDSQDPATVLAKKVATAIGSLGLNLSVKVIGGNELQILGSTPVTFIAVDSRILVSGRAGTTPAYGLQIPTANGLPAGVADGQTFSIQRGDTTLVFELDDNGGVGINNIAVPLNSGSTDSLAAAIVNAINGTSLGLSAKASTGGLIEIGAQADLRIQATNTVLKVVGVAGRPATIPVTLDLSQILTASQAAKVLLDRIAASNLPGVQLTQLASTILIEGARGVAGLGAFPVNGVRDLAGNAMRASEIDGKTFVTIFLGEGLDYGDAADPLYPSKKSSNGPTHVVVPGFSLGPTVTADADARVIDLDTDDGVTILPLTASFGGSIIVNVQGITNSRPAFINAWLDANGNGTFESFEKIPVSGRIGNGDNPISIPRTLVPGSSKTTAAIALRVRMSSQEAIGPTGPAPDGEVEDYYVNLNRNPYTNPSNKLDVNGDGGVSPLDVLQLVNYINFNGSGQLPFPVTTAPPPYLDVDGDGFVGPLDVITVINFINSQTSGGGVGEGESLASDRWISAATLAAPAVSSATNKSDKSQDDLASPAIQSLDTYLAMVASDVGPALAVDQLDWSSVLTPDSADAEDRSGLAHSLAIDDILGSLL